jgi:hypothetical protein
VAAAAERKAWYRQELDRQAAQDATRKAQVGSAVDALWVYSAGVVTSSASGVLFWVHAAGVETRKAQGAVQAGVWWVYDAGHQRHEAQVGSAGVVFRAVLLHTKGIKHQWTVQGAFLSCNLWVCACVAAGFRTRQAQVRSAVECSLYV